MIKLYLSFVLLISCVSISMAGADDNEERAKSLVSQMTLEEKIDYIGGYNRLNIRGIERLGIPEIAMSDGPMGCRRSGQSTAYPAAIGLAASWNRQLAGEFGTAIARDGRARGVHILLMPGVNIYRNPLCGRNFEYMGEDPYLAAEIAVPIVGAVQSHGIIATVKHYACNYQEYDRHNISSDVDERTLREIYLPAFRKVVQDGRVGAVMAAYNLVNGIHCTQNDFLNNQILKKEWGFDGILMSDWSSTYDAVGAANGGLDLEMPLGTCMNRENLIPAIESGQVSVATIDDKVLRILKTLIKMGFFDKPQKDANIPLDDPASAKVALQMARESIVLLKNKNNILPLNGGNIKSIAVLGPNADNQYKAHSGGGSAYTKPFNVVSVVDAVNTMAGGRFEVLTADRKTSEEPRFNFDDVEIVGNGFKCKVYEYNGSCREVEPIGVKPMVEKQYMSVNFSAAAKNFAVIDRGFTTSIEGEITPKKEGVYRLYVDTKAGAVRYLQVDGQLMLKSGNETVYTELLLERGRKYNIKLYMTVYPSFRNKWLLDAGCNYSMSFDEYAQAEKMKKADAVLLCVGFNPDMEFEGIDRSYSLPPLQEKLIQLATKLNKKTVVVVTAGGSFATENWIDNTRVLIHNWYPGQNGATALAEIIFGVTNPSGKLPISFEKGLEDCPTYNSYHDPDGDKHVKYTEGIFVGYRSFEKTKTKPLFPFGYGLSYTKFEYSNMEIISAGNKTEVSCDIKNTSDMAGAEIVQLYIGDVKCSVERPSKELKGFEKVFLEPGEKKTVKFLIGKDDLSFYSVEKRQWIAEPGDFKILIGGSSKDICLKSTLKLKD